MLEEFKKFAIQGNVMDMAVGVIIGAAFGKIVASLVEDMIMPPIGLLMGGVDFSSLFVTLSGKLVLIDGNHRAAKALLLGVDVLPAYLLTQEEADRLVKSRKNGSA